MNDYMENKHRKKHCISKWIFCFLAIALAAGFVLPAQGEIYRWQDKDGNWHFTDSPTTSTRPGPSPSALTNKPSRPDRQPEKQLDNQRHGGMLWRISIKGRDSSYLLGTIHSEDARVTKLKQKVIQTLDASDRFIMEMKLDTNAFMQFGTAMILTQEQDLESMIGKDLFTKVTTAMADLGIPAQWVRRMKPWVVMSMLSMPKPQGGLILDMVLYQRATDQGKPTSGLETAQEQLSVFEGLSLQDQISLLKTAIEHRSSQRRLFESLISAYVADDLSKIMDMAQESNTTQATQRLMVRLNDERNLRMVQRMRPYLRKGNSFVAVGALHLGGPKGILALLKERGYSVSPIR